ncbi:MAG: diacylglycerol/lipid kinase family protein, partial [Burkholderiales bacterium]
MTEIGASPPRRLRVLHKPVAGKRRRALLRAVLEGLAAAGAELSIESSLRPGHLGELAQAALAQGFDRLVVAGGDGSINEAANALAGSGLPLAFVPLGTANVLAHELGLEPRAETIVRAILTGTPRRVSLGRMTAGAVERRFLLMAGLGFDARVVAAVESAPGRKRRFGKGAYLLVGLREAFTGRRAPFALRLDGQTYEAAGAVIARSVCYAGPYRLSPAAGLAGNSFQVTLFERQGPLELARLALALATGSQARLPFLRQVRARYVELL